MIKKITLQDIGGGINLIDIGASGNLDPKWRPIESMTNLVGFDPNSEECERLNKLPHDYNSATYLPYAIAGEDGEAILYKTKSIYCYSLLKPNSKWLKRFSFSDLFEVIAEEKIRTHKLCEVPEIKDLDVDVMKSDTQGLELPILSNAGDLLDRTFYVETETGFTENYIGETTYSQIDEFMRSRGFLLFDINVEHRISRKNVFGKYPSGKQQILWCEAVWLKDYIELERQNRLKNITREKVLKSLMLCSLESCFDFGYELAEFFYKKSLITKDELNALEDIESWIITN